MVILVPSFMSLKASYKRLIYEGNTLYIEEASKTTINVESHFLLNFVYCEIWQKKCIRSSIEEARRNI